MMAFQGLVFHLHLCDETCNVYAQTLMKLDVRLIKLHETLYNSPQGVSAKLQQNPIIFSIPELETISGERDYIYFSL